MPPGELQQPVDRFPLPSVRRISRRAGSGYSEEAEVEAAVLVLSAAPAAARFVFRAGPCGLLLRTKGPACRQPESGCGTVLPELFSFAGAEFPHNEDDPLRGTEEWAPRLGLGAVKGFVFGTVTAHAGLEYTEGQTDFGEWAVEYLKRLSPRWRVWTGVEGTSGEVELIPEIQWHFSERAFLKLNVGIGLTRKTTDLAPEIGVMISF